ncbi:hypothetical protein [Glutamicibacter uratoxydans]|uniref:hypothetical protein n=1 Tax=Glutamicibacter uratoxydans TaxID=43667 RepID=UPI003D6F3E00
MSNNPLICALNAAAADLKAERYAETDPYELALALQRLATEVAYHLDQLKILNPDAIDNYRKHQDVGIPQYIPSSARVLLTGTLQVFIDSMPCQESA